MSTKTDQQIVDEYHRHKPEFVTDVRRLLSMLRIIQGKPKDFDGIYKLLVDAYGFPADFDDVWRDLFALEELNLIRIDADTERWHARPDADFWPFGI